MSSIFNFIAIPFGYVIEFFYSFTQNYTLSLFLFALVVKVILFPLGIKQQKNQIKQARLRPMEMAIRKKYAGRTDKPTQMKMNEEIQHLYTEQNFNPLSGCLPLLLQFPVILALYQVVINPLRFMCHLSTETIASLAERVSALGGEYADFTLGGNGYIKLAHILRQNIGSFSDLGLTQRDIPNFSLFGGAIDLSQTPNLNVLGQGVSMAWLLLLIPILTFVVQFASSRILKKLTYNPTAQQAGMSGCIMDFAMPLMSVFFCFMVPAAVAVYWIFQGVLGVLQQFTLVRMFPMPKFSEEELKAAEKTVNATQKKKSKPKSLYQEDDNDYSDYAKQLADQYAREDEEAALRAAEREELEEEERDSGAPKLKDDKRAEQRPKRKKK